MAVDLKFAPLVTFVQQ